jgi:hypothetical protein
MSTNARLFNPTGGALYAPVAAAAADRPAAPWALFSLGGVRLRRPRILSVGSGRVSPRPVPRPRWRRGPAAYPTVAVHCGHTGNVARNIYRTYARAVSYVRAAGSWPRCCAVKREAKFETSSLTLGGVVYLSSLLSTFYFFVFLMGPTLHLFGTRVNADHPVSCPVCVGVIRHHGVGGFGSSTLCVQVHRRRVPISGLDPRRIRPRTGTAPPRRLRSFDREARSSKHACTDADVRSVAISDLWAITMVHVV